MIREGGRDVEKKNGRKRDGWMREKERREDERGTSCSRFLNP